MSALFSRFRATRQDAAASESVAALISSLESSAERPALSHREFRKFIQEHGQSKTEAWMPIRAAARNNGGR